MDASLQKGTDTFLAFRVAGQARAINIMYTWAEARILDVSSDAGSEFK